MCMMGGGLKFLAPLGLNATKIQGGTAGFPRPTGCPTPTDSILPPSYFPVSRWDMSPLWGFKIFFYPMFYKHAGRGSPAQRVG